MTESPSQTESRSDAESHVVAVDFGTGGPKVGLVSFKGTVAWQRHYPVETTYHEGGGATQDAVQWWEVLKFGVREALAESAIAPEMIKAVSITGQWASTVPVDAAGVPVGPVMLWMDSRGGSLIRERIGGPVSGFKPREIAEWIRRSGGAPSLDGADPIGHHLYIAKHHPEVAAAARWYLEPVDYLTMCFTGVASASPASMTGSWLIDTRSSNPTSYDPLLISMAGIDGSKLPPLSPFGSVVGTISPIVAEELGLPVGASVVTGQPDLHSAVYGAGAVMVGEAHMAISTSGWISAPTTKKKTDIVRQVATVPGIGDGNYLIANNHETAGLCLSWLRDLLGGEVGFDDLTELASSSAPGAGGVFFTPWLNGERSPIADRRARGGFHNLSLQTTQADLVRAVMEGVAFNNLWLHQAVEKFTKGRVDDIRMIGGGAQSDLWCQIHADVMDRTIEQVADPLYCGLRGAALVAAVALGEVQLHELRGLVPLRETYRPDPAARSVYQTMFKEFPKLYSSQKRFFHRMNK